MDIATQHLSPTTIAFTGMPIYRPSTLLILALLLVAIATSPGQAQPPRTSRDGARSQAESQSPDAELAAKFGQLEPRYQQWLRSVRGLMTQAELVYFLDLSADFRRDAFLEEFWKHRDPDPVTPVNELRRR